MTQGQSVASGWYQDPTGRFQHRYWDGTDWTDHAASGGQATVDPLPTWLPPAETKRRWWLWLVAGFGALIGIIGAGVWISGSFVTAARCLTIRQPAGVAMRVGFDLMVLGPLVGWVVVPVFVVVRRRWLAWTVLSVCGFVAVMVVAVSATMHVICKH